MHNAQGQSSPVAQHVRWLALVVAFAIIGAMAVPFSAATAQTPEAGDAGVVDLAPATSLFFAQANLDTSSEQVQLASELFQRAGLENILEQESIGGIEELPANTQVGVVVTSIPDTSDIDVADVSVDPMAATESLEEGGFATIVSTENTDTIFSGELASMQGDAESGAGEIVESEYNGVAITSFEPASAEEFVDPTAIAMVGDNLVWAMRAEDIQPIIDTFNGDVPSLATNEQYQALAELLPTEYLSNGFINGPAILEAVEATAGDALSAAGPEATEALNAWTGFTFSAEDQGFRLETRSIASGEAFDELTPIDGSFFDTVPSDALFVTNGTNINDNGFITVLALLFASELVGEDLTATPAAEMDLEAAQDQVFAEAESLLGFNLKTDLIDNIVGEFGMVLSIGNITAEVPEIDALIVSDVQNPGVVQDAMSKIAFIVGAGLGDQQAIETREVNGSTVNVIDLSATGTVDKAEFGVVNDELVISVGSGLDDYTMGPESPLAQDPNFQAVMDVMPAEYGSLTYINMPVLLELVMGFSESMGGAIEDADASCGDYATQDEAQAAYDEDQFENFMLDQDFDGEACEDFFAPAAATPAATENPYSNVLGLATMTTQEDGVNGTVTFLLIGGE